ncbi:hypothetical protein A9Q84_17600 [Halobacteriovorax marinus]|uniref:Secreted protein n=1 Tax=Halobacteriovorax marinus TaxID=97084 RepID=A0A1Y5F368_9BACT|nr:hypothetical protein A9Q84_17600 [Halobacteriovorax marinus]
MKVILTLLILLNISNVSAEATMEESQDWVLGKLNKYQKKNFSIANNRNIVLNQEYKFDKCNFYATSIHERSYGKFQKKIQTMPLKKFYNMYDDYKYLALGTLGDYVRHKEYRSKESDGHWRTSDDAMYDWVSLYIKVHDTDESRMYKRIINAFEHMAKLAKQSCKNDGDGDGEPF